MIGLVATFEVKTDMLEQFESAAKDLMARVKAHEGGCLTYQLYKARGSTTRYIMMEEYASEAALQAHTKTEYYATLGAKIGGCLVEPPAIDIYDIVE